LKKDKEKRDSGRDIAVRSSDIISLPRIYNDYDSATASTTFNSFPLVTFRIHYALNTNEDYLTIGALVQFGNWNSTRFLRINYNFENHTWGGTIQVPFNTPLEWKVAMMDNRDSQIVRLERGLLTSANKTDTTYVDIIWREVEKLLS